LDYKKYQKRKWQSSCETPSKEKGGFYLQHVWRYTIDESARQAYNLLIQVNPSWKKLLDAAKKKNDDAVRKDIEWIAGLPSKKNEWRAFWCHSARGLGKGHNWDSSIKFLKENGFNVIIPNLAWGGVSFYKSSVLSQHPSVEKEGDAYNECIEACKKYCIRNNKQFLTVKTLDESAVYEPYNSTRAFYKKEGFIPLEVFTTYWNEENPCLFLVKAIR
jgi:hypothetical protein